jgi:hypothetical protein
MPVLEALAFSGSYKKHPSDRVQICDPYRATLCLEQFFLSNSEGYKFSPEAVEIADHKKNILLE